MKPYYTTSQDKKKGRVPVDNTCIKQYNYVNSIDKKGGF